MNLQDDIFLTVLQAKNTTGCMSTTFINMEKNGEDVECCEMKLMVLVKWIKVMENYYCTNFTVNGNVTDPDLPCLTQLQAQELLAKMKVIIG